MIPWTVPLPPTLSHSLKLPGSFHSNRNRHCLSINIFNSIQTKQVFKKSTSARILALKGEPLSIRGLRKDSHENDVFHPPPAPTPTSRCATAARERRGWHTPPCVLHSLACREHCLLLEGQMQSELAFDAQWSRSLWGPRNCPLYPKIPDAASALSPPWAPLPGPWGALSAPPRLPSPPQLLARQTQWSLQPGLGDAGPG